MKHIVIPVTRYQQNCSLLLCEVTRRAAIVDPGGDVDKMLAGLDTVGAICLETILITHGHLDHASAAGLLAQRTGATIEGPHEGDRFLVDELPDACRRRGFPAIESFTPSHWLQHGDTVCFGNEQLSVLHCPGHTPGHVAYFHAPSRLVMVGDILFRGSVGATAYSSYGDHRLLVSSIRNRLFPLGDDVRFVPGHGNMSTMGIERDINPFVADYLFE